MNITGFGYGSEVTLASAGGVSLVANGAGPNLETIGLTAGANVTLTPGASSVTITAASGAGVYLPLAGGTMAGNIVMGGTSSLTMNSNSIYSVNLLEGKTTSRFADDIVGDVGNGVTGNLSMYSGVAGGKFISDSGVPAANVVETNGVAGVVGQLASITNINGKVITSSGVVAADVVTGPASSVLNRIAVFAGTTGKVLADAGTTLAQYALLAGATFTGTVAMGSNAITSTGSITAATLTTTGNISAANTGSVTGTRFNAGTPMCYISYAQPIASISYTAATAKLIDLAGLTEQLDVSNEFTTNATTGKVTYTGTVTKYVETTIDISILPVASAQTITFWISKNGSLTQVCARNINFTASSPTGYTPQSVTMGYMMATNDTVQLAGQYSSTATNNIFECQYRLRAYC